MKEKVYTLLVLLAMVLGMAACSEKAPPTPTATPNPAGITLVPYTSQEFGISGVVPKGWVEVKPGLFQWVLGTNPKTLVWDIALTESDAGVYMAASQSDTIPRSCTVFAAAYGDTVLFGSNEDFINPNTYYWIIPSSDGNYGGVYVGFDDFAPQGGINEKGLAFDTNGLPPTELNPQSELPAPPPSWIVKTIMRKAATVEQAVDIAKRYHRYNWGLPMKYQVLLADATGDAVVVSAGPDGELAFTRKQEGDGFLVSTNFNRANPDSRYGDLPCWRYDTATTMLEKIQDEEDLTIDYFRSILDAVHVEGAETNTVYSNVFDLRNGVIYLYHWHQFDEVVALNVAEELARSPRHTEPYRIRDLVSTETADMADREYQRYQGNVDVSIWDHVAKGWLFLVAGSLTVVMILSPRFRKFRLGCRGHKVHGA